MQNNFAEYAGELEQQLEALKAAPHGDASAEAIAGIVESAHEVALRFYQAWAETAPSAETGRAIERLRSALGERSR